MAKTTKPKESRIDFNVCPKCTYISSDTPSYEDFKTNWAENHDGDMEGCPEEGSSAYWEMVADDQAREWDDFRSNMEYSPLMGHTLLYFGNYNSRYPDFQPSGPAGKVIQVNNVYDFLKFAGDRSDAQDIYIDKDGLHVADYHHDGSLSLEVRILTKKGEEYWERHGEQSYQCHKHLYETKGLTRKVNFYLF